MPGAPFFLLIGLMVPSERSVGNASEGSFPRLPITVRYTYTLHYTNTSHYANTLSGTVYFPVLRSSQQTKQKFLATEDKS